MADSTYPKRRGGASRARLLAIATLASGALVAGCGGSSGSPTGAAARGATTGVSSAANAGSATTTGSSTSAGATSSSSPPSQAQPNGLTFAKCMRANGVPNFPDPAPGSGGFSFNATGINPEAPAVQAAQAKCLKFMPTPSGGPAFSARSFAKVLKVARCMREHGVSEFPDPTTSRPSLGPGIREITDYDGAYLVFPATLNTQAPAYKQAAAACGSLAQKLVTGPRG